MKTQQHSYFLFLRLGIYILLALSAAYASYLTYTQRRELGVIFTNLVPEEGTVLRKIAYITGGIIQPGVYEIDGSTRISDLVDLAGGFAPDVNRSFVAEKLNLAALVEDEQHIFIPTGSTQTPQTSSANASLININTAKLEQLMELPGIGSAIAEKIIDGRPWASVESLGNLTGLGETKFKAIKDLVSL